MYIPSSTRRYRHHKHINQRFRPRATFPTKRGKTLSLTRKLLQNADVAKGNYTTIICLLINERIPPFGFFPKILINADTTFYLH